MESNKKILILAQDRAGKDTLAYIWQREFDLTWQSSSMYALRKFMFPILERLLGYNTYQEAFDDRVNHRELWYHLISSYNRYDPTRLAKGMLETSQAYIGMRDSREIRASINNRLFDEIILIDAEERVKPNPLYSFDWVPYTLKIYNNGTLSQFEDTAIKAGKIIFK
jgi:hypothetical protein